MENAELVLAYDWDLARSLLPCERYLAIKTLKT